MCGERMWGRQATIVAYLLLEATALSVFALNRRGEYVRHDGIEGLLPQLVHAKSLKLISDKLIASVF